MAKVKPVEPKPLNNKRAKHKTPITLRNGSMGRNPIVIDQDRFEDLMMLHCTLDEVAFWFRCSPDTIEIWVQENYNMRFSEVRRIKSRKSVISLRRQMLVNALEKNNTTMQIFLAKQSEFMGYTDRIVNNIKSEDVNLSDTELDKLLQSTIDILKDVKSKS